MAVRTPTPGLASICAAVDAMLEAVEAAATDPKEPVVRDVSDALLGAAYGRAYRCVRSIRELAGRGEADDALILTRSLLSLVGRSLYIVEPEDEAERSRRFDRARRTWAEDALKTIDDLRAMGFEPDADRERIAGIAEAIKALGVPRLPNDRDLLAGLGLGPYYPRVYRLASDVAHYSIGSALDGFLEYPDRLTGGGRVALKLPDADRSEEALALAAIVYGEFLMRCESAVRHGVTPVARQAMDAYMESAKAADAEA
jgi:Family of unknown function (DUF5677)